MSAPSRFPDGPTVGRRSDLLVTANPTVSLEVAVFGLFGDCGTPVLGIELDMTVRVCLVASMMGEEMILSGVNKDSRARRL